MGPRIRFREKLAKVKQWRKEEVEFVGIFVTALNFLGLWSDKHTKHGRPSILGKTFIATWACVLCPFFAFIGFVSSYKNRVKGDTIMNVLEPALTGGVLCVFMLYAAVMKFNGHRFVEALAALQYMLHCGRQLEEQPEHLVRKAKTYAELCVFYYLGGVGPFFLAGSGMIGMAYITKKFVFKAWFPYNFKSHPYFDLTIVGINVSVVSGFHLILLANGFLMLHFAHAVSQFKLLNYNLSRLNSVNGVPVVEERVPNKKEVLASLLKRRDAYLLSKTRQKACQSFEEEVGVPVKQDYRQLSRIYSSKFGVLTKHAHLIGQRQLTLEEIERRFKLCAQHHQAILILIIKFKAAFKILLLNQFFTSVAPTILSIVLVTSMKEVEAKLALFALPLSASLFNQWLYCWLGQKLTTEADLISDAIFGSNWFSMSNRFKRSMRIMIAMSNRPLVIMVGGRALSLESFYAVMKLAYTSYMSLKKVQGKILVESDEIAQHEEDTELF